MSTNSRSSNFINIKRVLFGTETHSYDRCDSVAGTEQGNQERAHTARQGHGG